MKTQFAGKVVLVLLLFLTACTETSLQNDSDTQNRCETLQERLDKIVKDGMSVRNCNQYNFSVGGTLISKEVKKYTDDDGVTEPPYYRHTLKVEGNERVKSLWILSNKSNSPYEEGKFYKFNPIGECYLQTSMQLSGTFPDWDFEKLQPMQCG